MANSHDTLSQKPEEWRTIPGYEGVYSVSSLGRVRRDLGGTGTCRAGRILSPILYTNGYQVVRLYRDKTSRAFGVHRLVAAAFIGPCPKGHQVNHLDGNKRNNRTDNLEYCTPKQNQQHAAQFGLLPRGERNGSRTHPERLARGDRHGRAKLSAEIVKEIHRRHAAGESYRTLAKFYSVSMRAISFAVKGETWKHVT